MATTVPVGEGIPPEFYRNAIDLNRFSNSVSKKLVTSYNNVMLKAVSQLEQIERQPLSKQPAYKTARLRALIKQTKQSLNSWANGSVDDLITELEGVAKVQAGFIEGQLKKSIPKGMAQKITDQIGYSVRSVAVSPSFAKSVVTTDPTAINLAVLKSELAGITKDKKARTKGTFKLTAEQGQTITLPNGNTVKKSFLGIAQAEAKRLNQVVRSGLLSGETTTDIVKDLVGNLRKDQKGSLSQLLAQGGAATKSANSQVMTIVRTTVNQVTNTASQTVYKANPDVTEEYRYVATLDSRTSPVCRDLDGQIFKYNQGPVPPQHFGCRSTTVAVVNYKKYGFTPPPAGKRASVGGPVPANTTYGKWLYGERAKGSKFKAGKEQIAALGEQKAKYFNRLANKYGPDQALKKLIREDNTEVSLAQLQKRYGKPEDIKGTVKKATTPPKAAPTPADIVKDLGKTTEIKSSPAIATESLDMYLKTSKTAKSIQEFVDDSIDALESVGGQTAKNTKKMRDFLKKSKCINNFNLSGDKWNFDQATERILIKNKKAFDAANQTAKKFNEAGRFNTKYARDVSFHAGATTKAFEQKNLSSAYFKDMFKHIFQPAGGSNVGYTTMYSTVVNSQVKTSSKKLTKKLALKMKKAENDVLLNNKAYADYWKAGDYSKPSPPSELFVNSSKFYDEGIKEIDWLSTMIHEIGHQVHFKGSGAAPLANKFKKMGGMNAVTGYSRKNPRELFAESFEQYVVNPEGLEKNAPRLYNWVEETLNKALTEL